VLQRPIMVVAIVPDDLLGEPPEGDTANRTGSTPLSIASGQA